MLQIFESLQVGQAVHVGGLMRLDLNHASVETIYVTIWASPNISLHLGKVENADEIQKKHVGIRLQVNFVWKNVLKIYMHKYCCLILSHSLWYLVFYIMLIGLSQTFHLVIVSEFFFHLY